MGDEPRISMLCVTAGRAKDFTSSVFGDMLDTLLDDLGVGNVPANPKILPFVLMCAAALEAKLNDHLVVHAFDGFPIENYKRISEAFLTMGLQGKLDAFVPILTNSQFIIDTNSKTHRSLSQLISIRNKIVHSKSFYEEVDVDILEEQMRFPEEYFEKLMAATFRMLSVDDCREFYEAINALDTGFLYPLESGTLKSNALVAPAK